MLIENTYPLLLTATVTPQVSNSLVVTNPHSRVRQYKSALERWCSSGLFNKIVICENSNFSRDLLLNGGIVDKYLNDGGSIEYLNCVVPDPKAIETYGKGYGELGIIQFAMNKSSNIQRSGGFVKCTGRLYINNMRSIIEDINMKPLKAICANLSVKLKYCDSRFFYCSNDFFTKYIESKIVEINDKEGIYFEHILAKSILIAIAADERWGIPSQVPWYIGQSGSMGKPYNFPLIEYVNHFIKKNLLKW